MGIRLEWEIEAEQNTYSAGEDPEAARLRRQARYRLLMMIALLLLLIAAAGATVFERLNARREREERLLRDAVEAEVTALRIGSWADFIAMQRSADENWIRGRRAFFDDYQRLKLEQDIRLTGRILHVAIDGQRGRVHVEEIIDGVPYTRVWFYWHYQDDGNGDDQPDGWRHVPPDFTFWGQARRDQREYVSVTYASVDAALAAAAGASINNWIHLSCAVLQCSQLPHIQIDIVPDDSRPMSWSEMDVWTLQFPSPYADRARSDMPFAPELQFEAAALIAERLVAYVSGGRAARYPADAYFLQKSVESWLVGRFTQIEMNTHLLTSLVTNYGQQVISSLITSINPDSPISILSAVTGTTSLDQANLDWRDFFSWRLNLENELVAMGDFTGFVALYDTRDQTLLDTAIARYNQNQPRQLTIVTLVQVAAPAADGSPQRIAVVQTGDSQREDVLFRLVDNVWRRAS